MLTLLIGPLVQLLLSTLGQFGVNVPPSVSDLIARLGPIVSQLLADIHAGGSPSAETVAILATLLPLIQAIKADTKVNPVFLAYATMLDDILTAILIADKRARLAIDPTQLKLEAPLADAVAA